jgi:hypothetical protein
MIYNISTANAEVLDILYIYSANYYRWYIRSGIALLMPQFSASTFLKKAIKYYHLLK